MAARQCGCLLRRRRRGCRSRVHREEREFLEGLALRFLFWRAEGGAFRAAPSRARAAASARCAGVDRRRQPDARAAPQTPAAVPREQPQAYRPRFRAQHLHARPSRDERPDGRWKHSPTRCWPSIPPCRPAPISTCRRICRCSTRSALACRPSSCGDSGTASLRSRTCPISSPSCRTRTSSSSSCRASRTPARARRTGGWSTTCSTVISASPRRSTPDNESIKALLLLLILSQYCGISHSTMTAYQALVLSLPARNSTVRMRVWRALKDNGCGVLRDGVYLLPAGSARAPALAEMESDIRAEGGFAMTVEMNLQSGAQAEQVRKLFDRSADYGDLVEKINAAKAALPRLGLRRGQTLVQRLRRSFEKLAESDFFPGPAKAQAEEALASLETKAQELYSDGEPRASQKRIRRLDPAKFQNRTWATRSSPWVDRLASAWLIKIG